MAAKALRAPHLQVPLPQAIDLTCNFLWLDAAEMFLHVHFGKGVLEQVMAAAPVPHLGQAQCRNEFYCCMRFVMRKQMDLLV